MFYSLFSFTFSTTHHLHMIKQMHVKCVQFWKSRSSPTLNSYTLVDLEKTFSRSNPWFWKNPGDLHYGTWHAELTWILPKSRIWPGKKNFPGQLGYRNSNVGLDLDFQNPFRFLEFQKTTQQLQTNKLRKVDLEKIFSRSSFCFLKSMLSVCNRWLANQLQINNFKP